MNGANEEESSAPGIQDRRPIITCAGEVELFSCIEDRLSVALPQEVCEWRRSLGRPARSVHISATFTPYNQAALPRINQWDLIRQPLFHIFWTECNDVDQYKTTIRDEIEVWLKELTAKDIPDWLIVVVENFDGKRANKLLPRTTVLDKIRTEFATKQGDRCISVLNPGREESRNADSWRGLVARIRHLLLTSYGRAVSKLEDYVRQQRERRNEPGWNFMGYFKLQEELAQVLEMLGLYDEALVQYDELDALFSQFVVNGQSGDATGSGWLTEFQRSLERWHALKLGPCALPTEPAPSLLELRAYLYSKQAHMLLLTNKVWEVASRCLPFLHACSRELLLLEISAPPGAVACWLFLASLEVLHTCNRHNQADQVEAYSLHTACLWAYASQKLRSLGDLCGLMPGRTPTSDQLHAVVYLSAGMGDCPGKPESPSPTDILKQALRSQTSFNKTYLELAELAMCTYKHIGRLRSARLVGREVASFYVLLGEVQKAAAFLTDALRTFEQDNWRDLAAQSQVELAECYRKAGDTRKYVRACAAIAAASEIDNLIRWSYFDEMQNSLLGLDRTLIVPFKNILRIESVRIVGGAASKSSATAIEVMQDSQVEIELIVESNFPREIVCAKAMIAVEADAKDAATAQKRGRRSSSVITGKDVRQQDALLQRLRIQRHLDYKENKQLSSASVVCRNAPLKRADSNVSPVYHSEFNDFLDTGKTPFVITPGMNVVRLSGRAERVGKFYLGQVAIHINLMELISVSLTPRLCYEVLREEPSVRLDKGEAALLSDIEQIMTLSVTIGSYAIETKGEKIKVLLKSSSGLSICGDVVNGGEFGNSLEITIEETRPYSTTVASIRVLAEVPSKDHQVTIICPWSSKSLPVTLSFAPPLKISWRLHTVKHRKYVQITVVGQCDRDLSIGDSSLTVSDNKVVPFHSSVGAQVLPNGMSVSFTYEILVRAQKESIPLKAEFRLRYAMGGSGHDDDDDDDDKGSVEECREYSYPFELSNYQTLYHIRAKVEPTKGSEFCRVGTVCHLHVSVSAAAHSFHGGSSLMYEVLAEPSVWAVCGRTAGVISFESDSDAETVVLDVMPLNSGFLPLPLVRLSKYIPADFGNTDYGKNELLHPRLEPFSAGQIYNGSKGEQVHVINTNSEPFSTGAPTLLT